MLRRLLALFIAVSLIVVACEVAPNTPGSGVSVIEAVATITLRAVTLTATSVPTNTLVPTPTSTATPTLRPSPTPTEEVQKVLTQEKIDELATQIKCPYKSCVWIENFSQQEQSEKDLARIKVVSAGIFEEIPISITAQG